MVVGRPSKASLKKAQRDLNDRQVMFVTWCATPEPLRNPPTKAALAEALGVNESTLWRWSNDPQIQQAIRWVVLQHAGDPRQIGNALDFLYGTFMREDYGIKDRLNAAQTWLKAVGVNDTFKGENRLLTLRTVEDIDLDSLSDDELWEVYQELERKGDIPALGEGAGGGSDDSVAVGVLDAGFGASTAVPGPSGDVSPAGEPVPFEGVGVEGVEID